MATSVSFLTVGFLALLGIFLVFLGVRLIRRGFWPIARGDQPHCRHCGYLLIGIESQRCPECGTILSELNIIRGSRKRSPGLVCGGAVLLLLGITPLILVIANSLSNVNWYHLEPTFLVMRDLNSASASLAMSELSRRDANGSLSSKYRQQLVEMGLVQQAGTSQSQITQALIEFVERQYMAGNLSQAQKDRFGQQFVSLALRVRPIVVLGDAVPYEVLTKSRVSGNGYWVGIFDKGGEVEIDGDQAQVGGSGSESMSGLGSGGSSGGSVKFPSLGKHQLQLKVHAEFHQGNFGSGPLLFQIDRTLTGPFEIISKPPPGSFKLNVDPKVGQVIRASIQPGQFTIGAKDRKNLQGQLKIATLPANIAFNVFARIEGHEYTLSSITCNTGGATDYQMGGSVREAVATTQPATFDLILRSSEKVAKETIDQNNIWSGELVYPNVPMGIDPNR